jgi:Secretion system C-terminal sorting domain
MQKFFTFLFSLFLTFSVFAQLPNGSIAPNFTGVDINGNTWNLYDILNSGKSVIIDVSATWCSPCWSYHQTGALDELYAQHGPAGDDKLMVLWVEGDANTNLACLSSLVGCNLFTQGDWVSGTDYPIIDDASIADVLAIEFYPTVYLVCPDKIINAVGPRSVDDLWAKVSVCPVAFGTNNAGIFNFNYGTSSTEICAPTPVAPSMSLKNLGSANMTSATVTLKWNGTLVETINWTGNLAKYDDKTVNFNQIIIDQAGTLLIEVVNVNGVGDDQLENNTQTVEFTAAPSFISQKVVLEIKTDNYGDELYWEMHDNQGNVLNYGGNESVGANGGGAYNSSPLPSHPNAYGAGQTYKDTLLIPTNGCYSMYFVDAFGDGLCCTYGNGYYKMYNLGSPTTIILEGAAFKATETRSFSGIGATNNIEDVISLADFEVYPNPASDLLNVDYVLNKKSIVQISITNTLGQVVKTQANEIKSEGNQLEIFKINDLANGIYLLNLRTEAGLVTKKFVKN